MPKNNFDNRQECTKYPNKMHIGDLVKIIKKENQGSSDERDLVIGYIKRILSHGKYYRNGIKVELTNGVIGRVQYLVCEAELLNSNN